MRTRVASQVGYPLLGVLLILVTWLLICWIGNLPTVVLPTPDKVLRAFIDRFDLLVSEGWFTLKETLGGFLLALLIGLPISIGIANSRPLNLMFYPLLVARFNRCRRSRWHRSS